VGLLAKLFVSALLIWLVCRKVDFTTILRHFGDQDAAWLLAAAAITLGQILLGALRWGQILDALAANVTYRMIFAVTYIGSFFNCWLLGNAGGDIARMLLAPAQSHGRATIVHSVLFDRIVTLFGLSLAVLPLILLNIGPLSRSVSVIGVAIVASLPWVAMCGGSYWIAKIAADRRGRLSKAIFELCDSWCLLYRARQRLVLALVFAVLGQILISAAAYCLARAQHIDVSFVDFLALMPPVVLITALPISAGGWGVRESAMVTALGQVGMTASSALLDSVEMGLLAAIVSLPGSVIWLFRYFRRSSSLAFARQ
jgi:uncharacterized protein (TIRG00374 family)